MVTVDGEVNASNSSDVIYDGEGKCLDCGYALRQLTTARCPECGRGFDPGDESTMWMGRVPGPIGRFLLKPVGWPLHIFVILVGLLTIYADMLPGDDLLFDGMATFGWIIVGGVWFGRLMLFIIAEQFYYQLRKSPTKPSIRWLVGPGIILLVMLLVWTDWPEEVGFMISRPAMERLAEEVMAADDNGPFPSRMVGVYYARDIEKTSNGMQFMVSVDLFTETGFCYSPNGAPGSKIPAFPLMPLFSKGFKKYSYTHHGHWYLWTD